eukprot:m.67545 g.67545  ORF g.67545 m.67545 type:complete len:294 (+) comp14120_c0_seq2:224-1105(+)
MAQQDRTDEFHSAVQYRRSQTGFSIPPPARQREKSGFARIAEKINQDISDTTQKLQKLSILASKRGLYDDRPFEIQELTAIVKQDINSLNRAIAKLKEHVHSQGQPQTNRALHSQAVVLALQSSLATISKKFKHVLETRTENMKAARERRGQFTSGASYNTGSSAQMSTLLGRDDSSASSSVAIDMSAHQQQQEMTLVESNAYMEERADAVKNIESTIVELGQIFQQLATMIHEQGQQVQRIDEHVSHAEANVDAAHTELVKYFNSITSSRWLMLKIFGVLIFFFIVFVVFAA